MIGRLALALREWLLDGLTVCAQCRCLADKGHGSASCGRFLRDSVHELSTAERLILRRLRALEESRDQHGNLLQELQALTGDPFADEARLPA